jgi:uncharacterized repeat protein (TIGR01451 family)
LGHQVVPSGAASDGLIAVGEMVTFTVAITNSGPTTLVTLPMSYTWDGAKLALVSASPTGDSQTPGLLTWQNLAGSGLAPGEVVTVTLVLRGEASTLADPGGITTNRATVSGAVDSQGTSAAGQSGDASIGVSAPGVQVAKQVAGSQVNWLVPGNLVTFTLHLLNTGDTTLTDLQLIDRYDTDALTFARADVAPTTAQPGVLTWELADLGGALQPGAEVVVTTVFTVTGEGTEMDNTLQVADVVDEYGHGISPVQGSASVSLPIAKLALVITSDPPTGSVVAPGACIFYTHTLTNTGAVDLTNVVLTVNVPEGTDLVDSCPGEERLGGRATTQDRVWQIGEMAIGEVVALPMPVVVRQEIQVPAITVRGVATSEQTDAVGFTAQSVNPLSPTAIELLSFTALHGMNGVQVAWVTGWEVDSFGFHVWRSASLDGAESVRVTPNLIPAQGGGTYQITDPTGQPGDWYWLHEVQLDGSILVYGPIQARPSGGDQPTHSHRIFLPLVDR